MFTTFLAYICILRIPLTLLQLYNLKYLSLETKSTYFCSIISEIMQLSLAIFANFLYYRPENEECRFYIVAGIFMLYIYYVLYKICIFILVAVILIPYFIYSLLKTAHTTSRDNKIRRQLYKKLVRKTYCR